MNMIDTRDLDKELDELEAREDDEQEDDGLTFEENNRLRELRDLRDEVGSEWSYGETLIPESEFQDYARAIAEDLGALDANPSWPYTCIDWEQAANELSQDYTSVHFDGTDYYFRSS